jgi:hypothetical protein
MLESICGQDFAYAHEVEEDWAKELVKLEQKKMYRRQQAAAGGRLKISSMRVAPGLL